MSGSRAEDGNALRFEADGGQRLDVLLSARAGLSRSRAAALIEDGYCELDGRTCTKPGLRPRGGCMVSLRMPEPVPAAPAAEDLPIEILYEDTDLAAVVKPRGMVVHPAAGHSDGTLVNALLARLSGLSGIGGELRPGIVHRLDRDTSGLILIAKNDETHLKLSRMLAERKIEKHYRAMVEGVPKDGEGRIELPIGRDPRDRKKMAVIPGGREAVTEWRMLAEGRACALLDVRILTGRTHQIRVHMRSMNHPVCGDPVYGFAHGVKTPCLMLHAYSLSFAHPRTGEKTTFTAPLPDDFLRGLKTGGIEA